jgi:hypothetical protein
MSGPACRRRGGLFVEGALSDGGRDLRISSGGSAERGSVAGGVSMPVAARKEVSALAGGGAGASHGPPLLVSFRNLDCNEATTTDGVIAPQEERKAPSAAFGEPEQWQFDWERQYTGDDWLDQVPTSGGHNLLPPDKLQELMAGIGAAVDTVGGSFTMAYTTVVLTAARTDSPDPVTP